jgi:murein DD-endopeptidase MepM/ murein hydrolase activator NlpD
MKVLIRLVAVLTVLMSMALMAVSVYAAKTEPAAAPASGAGEVAPGSLPPLTADQRSTTTATARPASDVQIAPSQATRAPLRFAAPDDATQVGVSATGVSRLSTAVRVWSVPSFRSGLFGEGASNGADIPSNQLETMRQVGAAFGLPWQVLAGIAKVESDFGNNMATSSAGAIGYGQFLPDEWEIYGAGGDPYNYRDALLAMARYLIVAGAPADIPDAIYSYNHSWEYVEAVLSYAATLGFSSAANGANFIWPVLGPISSYFGPSHPLGIDIDQAASPNAPVWAAHDGTVVFTGGDACCSYGNYVIVQGASGIATLYAHLDTIAVSQGQVVQQRQVLGSAGCTGHCTGPHLHFEVIDNGVRRNPLDYLPGGA